MIVPLDKLPLEGACAERFLALAQTIARAKRRNPGDFHALLQEELRWIKGQTTGQLVAYEASIRVLLDLARLGWEIREQGYGIELIAEPSRSRHSLPPDEVLAEKQKTRGYFASALQTQLGSEAVRDFVRRMEQPSAKSGKKPITALIAEGAELHARLSLARRSGGDDPLAAAVSPYLQLASGDGVDGHTGHLLREIWRYFRYTWSIPQFATPGRQLLYLVRDAAHPCHAVMGIIGLNNCALQMGEEREYHLGWSLKALAERLNAAAEFPDRLNEEYAWMQAQIAAALEDVETSQLVEPSEIEAPNHETIAKLRRLAQSFNRLRDEVLQELHKGSSDGPIHVAEMETDYEQPPVSDEMLLLEGKSSVDPVMQQARRHLVARKRAALLAELLHARLTLTEQREGFLNPERLADTLRREDVGIALQTVLAALKSRFVGINMLEISTLVYLGTTSLYAHGSSQYERVRLVGFRAANHNVMAIAA
ncbi:hypothetical protein MTYM_00469 [Methylococcales bacterium]|nr:hypothetical protein MTYM_00469 [Methylococcales bacterium]